MGADASAPKKKQPTRYIVLEGVELTDGQMEEIGRHPDQRAVWLPVLCERTEEGIDGEVRIFEAANRDEAIYQYTGRPPRSGGWPEGEDLKPGQWKAVALSSWKGGRSFTARQLTVFSNDVLDG